MILYVYIYMSIIHLNNSKLLGHLIMTRFEVVFIATPALGNLVPIVEFADLLTKHNPQLSATVLTVTTPQRPLISTYVQSRASSATNLKLLHLPTVDPPTPDQYQSFIAFVSLHIQNHKHQVKNALLNLKKNESNSFDSVRLVALFVDMFSTTLIDVAAELAVPCYLFFASPASFLGFTLHLDRVDPVESESELAVPSFENPLPRSVLPNLVLDANDAFSWVAYHARRYRETKGIFVNTVQELEPHALQSLYNDSELPRVYPIGPVLDLVGSNQWDPNPAQYKRIMEWLDQQPVSSVVFVCFGSMGSLKANQVEEIATGLEMANVRFLWALREPPKAQLEDPRDYTNPKDVLPDGFLERTAEMGLVCGWVPQAVVLAHKAVGGFVSHCGWNSILESLWHGVPIATWPVYAEQQMNAFQMVRELGLAVEIRVDYRVGGDLVRAEEVLNGVRSLMKGADEIQKKVKEMSDICRSALMENRSSYNNLVFLIQQLTS
ncbi:UDP-glycosyltransferase 43 [Glycine max]|nr:UDP-glycosyltransferase 43 [Glycine max]|eukprot:XP_003533826.1 UDP-glycosyltransferase 43 [Glycine max]